MRTIFSHREKTLILGWVAISNIGQTQLVFGVVWIFRPRIIGAQTQWARICTEKSSWKIGFSESYSSILKIFETLQTENPIFLELSRYKSWLIVSGHQVSYPRDSHHIQSQHYFDLLKRDQEGSFQQNVFFDQLQVFFSFFSLENSWNKHASHAEPIIRLFHVYSWFFSVYIPKFHFIQFDLSFFFIV